jgi:positive regulator of sigma E activity
VFRQQFTAADAYDGGRACRNATLVWVVALIGMAIGGFALAKTLSPADYLLASNVMSITVNVLLVVWTIRYVSTHLERAGEALRAAHK